MYQPSLHLTEEHILPPIFGIHCGFCCRSNTSPQLLTTHKLTGGWRGYTAAWWMPSVPVAPPPLGRWAALGPPWPPVLTTRGHQHISSTGFVWHTLDVAKPVSKYKQWTNNEFIYYPNWHHFKTSSYDQALHCSGQGAARGPPPGAVGCGPCLGLLRQPCAAPRVPLRRPLHPPPVQPPPLPAPDRGQGGQSLHLPAQALRRRRHHPKGLAAPAAPSPGPARSSPRPPRRPSASASTSPAHHSQRQLTLEPFFLASLPGLLHA